MDISIWLFGESQSNVDADRLSREDDEGLHTSACGIAVLAGRSPSAFPERARAAKFEKKKKKSGAGGARAACATLVALRAVARTATPAA